MLINNLMMNVWETKRKRYDELVRVAKTYSAEELFEKVKYDEMTFYSYPGVNMNLFSCFGCSYRLNHNFAGCSMCNYENENLEHQAYMLVLREKNKELYAKAILCHLKNKRGKISHPNIFELLSSYDVFNDNEFPEEVFFELFKKNNVFVGKPFGYIFEVRASSVTKERLKLIKKYIPHNGRVTIEFGVETGNEWIRNHWLNKSITNEQVAEAIELIRDAGYRTAADVLIGIPGLMENHSKDIFLETVFWLKSIGVDQYNVLPLNRKELTLQGIIYKYLCNNYKLKKMGIAQGKHTGIPWLTTIVTSLNEVFIKDPHLLKVINISQVYSYQNSVDNIPPYNQIECTCNEKLIGALGKYQKKRSADIINDAANYAMSNRHKCSAEYQSLVNLQRDFSIKETIKTIAQELMTCWEEEKDEIYNKFVEEELIDYKEGI